MDGGGWRAFRPDEDQVTAHDRRWKLLSYDVRDQARYRQVLRLMKGVARRVQLSVFRARMDDRELERLRWELARVMTAEDDLLVIDLCPHCAARVSTSSDDASWGEAPETFRIVGGDQAPPDGDGRPPADGR